jgi:hypothetical protein
MRPKNKIHNALTTIVAYAIIFIIVAAAFVVMYELFTTHTTETPATFGLIGTPGY